MVRNVKFGIQTGKKTDTQIENRWFSMSCFGHHDKKKHFEEMYNSSST